MARGHGYSAVDQIIVAAVEGSYTLLVPEEVLDELEDAWARKPFQWERLSREVVAEFIQLLREMAEIIPRQLDPIPAVLRDPRDDFLLIAAAMSEADYLVTGDRDLLDIRDQLARPKIVTVAVFLRLLPTLEM